MRVALVHTTDPYTRMTPGEEGTVARVSPDRIDVDWDCGSCLAMIPSEGDQVKVIGDNFN